MRRSVQRLNDRLMEEAQEPGPIRRSEKGLLIRRPWVRVPRHGPRVAARPFWPSAASSEQHLAATVPESLSLRGRQTVDEFNRSFSGRSASG